MLVVQVCDFGVDGDSHYRVHSPSRFLSRTENVTVIDCHFYHRHLPDLLQRADVAILQFIDDWDLLALCQHRRAAGKITIFEANDYFFDIQPWNPIADGWQNRELRELYLRLLEAADGVQTSTAWLAERWRECGAKEVAVFENHLASPPTLPAQVDRPFTIGWAGSPGHFGDWYAMASSLRPWLARHADVRLAVMCNEAIRPVFDLPPERYSFSSFGSMEQYTAFLRSLDVGVAPLLPTGYNRGRSDVKFLEYASQGVVGIYSDLEPYKGVVVDGKTGFLADSLESMLPTLDRLKVDRDLRGSVRTDAFAYVSTQRLLENHIQARFDWYLRLLEKDAIATRTRSYAHPAALGAHILVAAQAEGQYLTLKPGVEEQLLLKALQGTALPQAVKQLYGIVARSPHYAAAQEALGQKLNDQRMPSEARVQLEQALVHKPWSHRIKCEIGRSLFLSGDPQLAKLRIEACIQRTPEYLPAWKYLVRLCGVSKLKEAVELASAATKLFEQCYTVALLQAEVGTMEQQVEALRAVLDRYSRTLSADERKKAREEFVRSVVGFARRWPARTEVAEVLEQTLEFFPESIVARQVLVDVLASLGDFEGELRQQRELFEMFKQYAVVREELAKPEQGPVLWQVADFVLRTTGG